MADLTKTNPLNEPVDAGRRRPARAARDVRIFARAEAEVVLPVGLMPGTALADATDIYRHALRLVRHQARCVDGAEARAAWCLVLSLMYAVKLGR